MNENVCVQPIIHPSLIQKQIMKYSKAECSQMTPQNAEQNKNQVCVMTLNILKYIPDI